MVSQREVAGLYAQRLAEKGYITIISDPIFLVKVKGHQYNKIFHIIE